MKCAECSHWSTANEPSRRRPVGFGACLDPHFLIGYDTPGAARDEVVIEGDEGWGFFTGPDFGCVHFVAGSPKKGE